MRLDDFFYGYRSMSLVSRHLYGSFTEASDESRRRMRLGAVSVRRCRDLCKILLDFTCRFFRNVSSIFIGSMVHATVVTAGHS